jgi:hypothetical protein
MGKFIASVNYAREKSVASIGRSPKAAEDCTHSMTLARSTNALKFRQVLECGCPLPLF